jgi:hypothetical protein
MSERVTINVAGQEYELKLTMLRMELFQEYTGIDLANGKRNEKAGTLTTIAEVGGALYALAGGEHATGLSLEDFKDALSPQELREFGAKYNTIRERDTSPSKEGGQGNARKRKSPSRT